MDITPLIDSDQKIIQSYCSGKFKVSGDVYEGSVLVAPNNATLWYPSNPIELEDFQPLIDISDTIDIVLFGTGDKTIFLNPELKKSLKEKGLHIECMDSGAACRTYNVLLSEARRVIAALLPVS